MTTDDESQQQTIKGTTGGGNVGSVPLMTLLDEYARTQDTRWRGMLDEQRTYRAAQEESNRQWRDAHERVHTTERHNVEAKTAVLDKRLDTLNGERAQINSERDSLATKEALYALANATRTQIEELDKRFTASLVSADKTHGDALVSLRGSVREFQAQLRTLAFLLLLAMAAISIAVRFVGH